MIDLITLLMKNPVSICALIPAHQESVLGYPHD